MRVFCTPLLYFPDTNASFYLSLWNLMLENRGNEMGRISNVNYALMFILKKSFSE